MAKKELHEIESTLWNMANKLRGTMDASEYKNYILAFMFYRYLSEKQDRYIANMDELGIQPGQKPAYVIMEMFFGTTDLDQVQKCAAQTGGFTKLYKEKTDASGAIVHDEQGAVVMEPTAEWVPDYEEYVKNCANHLGYCISPLYSWPVLETLIAEHGIRPSDFQALFDAFNFSLKYNEDAQKDFSGVFNDVNLGNTRLGTTTVERAKSLSRIIDLVDSIDYIDESGKDILGAIYEYLIKQFAANAGKKGGEFYTPTEVSKIMSRIVTAGWNGDDEFSVFDPACGSGSLLLTVGKTLDEQAGKKVRIVYYGQELNTTTYNLARMNLMMNDVPYDRMHLKNADTLGPDWPDGKNEFGKDHVRTFQAVVENPPYSSEWDAPDSYIKDARFRSYKRLAPKKKADYAFVLDGLYHLKPEGTMAVVLPHGVLFRGAAELEIRKALIEKGKIYAVIGLPANLFYGAAIPTIIMVLKEHSEKDIFFIDASQEFRKEKNKNRLTQENIDKIVNTYLERKDVEKYARLVSYQEIEENDFNLNIPRYVDTSVPEPDIDLKEIDRELENVRAQIAKLEAELAAQMKELGV